MTLLALLPILSAAQGSWTPSPAMLPKLATYQKVEGYSIRPPKGYTGQQQNQGPAVGQAWVSQPRPDGVRSWIMVVVGKKPPTGKMPDLKVVARTFAAATKNLRTDWKMTEPELGKLGGIAFARIRWTGTEPNTKMKMRGFIFAAIDGDKVIQISSQDVEPGAEKPLALAEASALTFKK